MVGSAVVSGRGPVSQDSEPERRRNRWTHRRTATVPGEASDSVCACPGSLELVIVVGGDGTVREVVEGLAQRHDSPPIAVVPAGVGNDFAKLVNSGGKRAAFKRIKRHEKRQVDLLRCNRRLATNVVSLGYDASVLEKASGSVRMALMRYAMEAVRLILKGMPVYPMSTM